MNKSMKIYKGAVVDFPADDVAALEPTLTRLSARNTVLEGPPEFPLRGAQVVFNGDQATITLAQSGRKHRRICRLTQAHLTEGKRDNDPTVITGVSVELYEMGIGADDARITASILDYQECSTCN